MDTTDTPPAPGRMKRALSTSRTGVDTALRFVRGRRHDALQGAGAVSVLGGIYHGFGLTATLIIGGVAVIVGSMLREGDRI